MTKILCDACGVQIKDHKNLHTIVYRVHIEDIVNGKLGGYSCIGTEFNRISGREETWEVCNSCYNKIATPMVKRFFELRDEAIKEGKIEE